MKIHMYISMGLYLLVSQIYGLVLFERKPEKLSKRWQRLGEADPGSLIHLKVALSSPDDDLFEERALQIATPFSGHYRRHLTASELAERTNPSKHHVNDVLNWLSGYGIQGKQNHDLIEATVSISKAQSLLNTTYYYFHDDHGRAVRRADAYYVPAHIAQIVEFVHPTVNFPHQRHQRESGKIRSLNSRYLNVVDLDPRSTNSCDQFLTTPACVEQFYNVDYTASVNTNVSVEMILSYGHLINQTNLRSYLEHFNPSAAKAHANFTYHHIGKTEPADKYSGEEELDIQMILGHGWPVKASYASLQGQPAYFFWGPRRHDTNLPPKKKLRHYEDYYVDLLHSFAHKEFVPAAITDSETAYESDFTPKYLRYLCKVYSQITTRGVSIFAPSGDGGSETFFNRQTEKSKSYRTNWPNTCPWVTSVGGTVNANGTEKALTFATRQFQGGTGEAFPSGGGFSQLFPRPKYQDIYVQKYLNDYHIAERYGNLSGYNGDGKGYPDVALFGNRIAGFSDGKVSHTGGTSASSPMAAALIGRLADYERSKGRPPLGFLNPWFYSHAQILNDITCCGDNDPNLFNGKPPANETGYPVTKGWDAVTGLGSFNFAKMRKSLDDLAAAGAFA